MPQMPENDHPGQPSVFACPDCGGVLWELEEKRSGAGMCAARCLHAQRNLTSKITGSGAVL